MGYIKKFNDINTEINDVNWGTVELTKVIKKDDISTFFKLMGPKKSPAYIKNSNEFLSEVGQNTQGKWKTYGKRFSENLPSETVQENIIEIPEGKSSLNFLAVENSEIVQHFTESVNFLPCTISSKEPTRLEILSASNSSIYIKPYGEIVILGNTLTPDRNKAYKLKLDKFERSADRSEWCAHKSISDL